MATTKKRYKVVGQQAIDGHAPGEEFEAFIPDDREEFYKQIGALKIVKDLTKEDDKGKS